MKAAPCKLVYAKGYFPCEIKEATHVKLHMPGPFPLRYIPVILSGPRADTGCWSWNGDTEKPTLKPSIKTWNHTNICHTFVNDGRVQFLEDCTHELRGQNLELLEVDHP